MSFQWVIDNAEVITVNKSPVVAVSTARDGTTRTVSRGDAPWSFEVTLPEGIPWEQVRVGINEAEIANRIQNGYFNFAHTGYSWLFNYRGTLNNPNSLVGDWVRGSNQLEIVMPTGNGSGYAFRKGDIVQLSNTGKVYTIIEDVLDNATTATLHRKVIESSSAGQLVVGPNCTFNVICTQFPNWSLIARNQVGWTGTFRFIENIHD